MKLIDVLVKLANNEIKNGTILTIDIDKPSRRQYKYYSNAFLDDYNLPLNIYGENCLNQEVKLMEPKNIRYYLKLVAEDDDSYVACDFYDPDSNWFLGSKAGVYFSGLKAKFTQEEINGSTLLKFVEKYGVKEEAKDDEDEAKND